MANTRVTDVYLCARCGCFVTPEVAYLIVNPLASSYPDEAEVVLCVICFDMRASTTTKRTPKMDTPTNSTTPATPETGCHGCATDRYDWAHEHRPDEPPAPQLTNGTVTDWNRIANRALKVGGVCFALCVLCAHASLRIQGPLVVGLVVSICVVAYAERKSRQ